MVGKETALSDFGSLDEEFCEGVQSTDCEPARGEENRVDVGLETRLTTGGRVASAVGLKSGTDGELDINEADKEMLSSNLV